MYEVESCELGWLMVVGSELRHWPPREKNRLVEGLLPTKADCSEVVVTTVFFIPQKAIQQINRGSCPAWPCTKQPWTGTRSLQVHSKGGRLISTNKNHKYKVFQKQKEREETSGQSSTVSKFWFLTNSLNDLVSPVCTAVYFLGRISPKNVLP